MKPPRVATPIVRVAAPLAKNLRLWPSFYRKPPKVSFGMFDAVLVPPPDPSKEETMSADEAS